MVWITSFLLISIPKVILVCNLPAGKSNSTKAIHILVEWFCDHGTPEVLCTDNAYSMLILPLQIGALNGVSPMKPPVHTTHNPMDLLSYMLK